MPLVSKRPSFLNIHRADSPGSLVPPFCDGYADFVFVDSGRSRNYFAIVADRETRLVKYPLWDALEHVQLHYRVLGLYPAVHVFPRSCLVVILRPLLAPCQPARFDL